MIMSIIVWVPLIDKLLLGGVHHTVVAERPKGLVVAMADKDAARLDAPGIGGKILYFSRRDYDEAAHDLAPSELDEAIDKRLAEGSSVELGEWAVTTAVRSCLARSASEKAAGYFAPTLAVLADLLKGRLDGFSDRELFDAMEQAEVELRAEARAATKEMPAGAPRYHEVELGATQTLADLAEPAISLGLDDYRKVELHVSVMRVYFIAPLDAALREKLQSARAVHVPFDGGVAVQWAIHRIGELATPPVPVLDVEGDRLLDLLTRLAKPQLLRELRKRRSRAVDTASYDAWLDVLGLESAVTVQRAAKIFSERGKTFARAVARSASAEGERLRLRWTSGSTYAAPVPLRTCHERAVATADLVRRLALTSKDADAAARMHTVHKALIGLKP